MKKTNLNVFFMFLLSSDRFFIRLSVLGIFILPVSCRITYIDVFFSFSFAPGMRSVEGDLTTVA